MVVTNPSDRRMNFIDADDLRTSFSLAMSAMYKMEVPLYGSLMTIVRKVNEETLAQCPRLNSNPWKTIDVASERLELERHGAIRLGTPEELQTVCRMFNVLGMYPVDYYDLSPAGLPMHATCFRPTTATALKRNPFRVFTTLLRPELLTNQGAKDMALDLLANRAIFSERLLAILDIAESQRGRLEQEDGKVFVQEAVKTFGWQPIAAASSDVYQYLKDQHPILADIACFQSAHINHLTPRTLDIVAAQGRMKDEGLAIKQKIEGPPPRNCPILLRQTSFLALEEQVKFPTAQGGLMSGSHKARFGEVEERGAAVTPAGRCLYNQLLTTALERITNTTCSRPEQQEFVIAKTFAQYPDSWDELRRAGLVYFEYRCSSGTKNLVPQEGATLEALLSTGALELVPITYEDFLPLSAAGIFQSNLGASNRHCEETCSSFSDKPGYERAMRRSIIDSDSLYAEAQEGSLRACATKLGLPQDAFASEKP
jgi:uncharacterized glyoxalase superfamily metalloenzyme YdcJ